MFWQDSHYSYETSLNKTPTLYLYQIPLPYLYIYNIAIARMLAYTHFHILNALNKF